MKRTLMGMVVLGGLVAVLMLAPDVGSQPPGGKDKGPRGKGPRGKGDRLLVMPPFVRDKLELTKEQEKQLADLDREVRAKLKKILTPEQHKQMEEALRRGPGGPPGRGPGRPGRPPEDDVQAKKTEAAAGIAWFATWESGAREARRTARPILLVSAAPHCAGVSGIW
jgi:Spy/CpxP family protein refolding chaperone